jgi:hypothetical protein
MRRDVHSGRLHPAARRTRLRCEYYQHFSNIKRGAWRRRYCAGLRVFGTDRLQPAVQFDAGVQCIRFNDCQSTVVGRDAVPRAALHVYIKQQHQRESTPHLPRFKLLDHT